MTKNDSKRNYVLLSDYYSEIHGTCVVTMVSVYSLDEQVYGSLKREQSAFLTRSGRLIDSIEVRWDDYSGYSLPDNYWGISMDNPHNTGGIFILPAHPALLSPPPPAGPRSPGRPCR